MILGLVAILSLGAVYHTSAGSVPLAPASDSVALEVGDAALLSTFISKQPGVAAERLFGAYWLLSRVADPATTGEHLLASGAAVRLLAAYHPAGSDALLIADERIRARFERGLAPEDVQRRAKLVGAASVRLLRAANNLYEVLAPSPRHSVSVAAALTERHLAVWAHPDFIYRHERRHVPNDPLFGDQWHHALIGASGAWELTTGTRQVAIAILDSGVDLAHEDFANQVIWPRDTLEQDDDPTPDTYDGHGTCTAGLALARGDNGTGVIGVCPRCLLMPIRIMGESLWGRYGADSDAFYWAGDHGAQVLSNSWGSVGPTPVADDLDEAIRFVAELSRDGAGAVILFASGNDGRRNRTYELASHPLVLGVGATDRWDVRESYSNFGDELDLVAPAAAVTTDISGRGGYDSGDYTYEFNGTSAACPVAAGVAGLVFSLDAALTRGQVMSVLTATADKVGGVEYADGFNAQYGYGRVNALRAAQMASGGEVCVPAPEECGDGVDNDCDWLADMDDPSCTPRFTPVGAACALDLQCSAQGQCLRDDEGYPGGYCTMSCALTCPAGAGCAEVGGAPLCLARCEASGDCRDGYVCAREGAERLCVPLCTIGGCVAGELCDEETGDCVHDGDSAPGGRCESDTDCAADGWCLEQIAGGYCVSGCDGAQCPAGSHCADIEGNTVCVDSCLESADCRDGLACWPESADIGHCWWACSADADCRGEPCNEWGLCGAIEPPRVPAVCACDTSGRCQDGCDCDPDCDDSCAAIRSGWTGALLVLTLLLRRRVRRVFDRVRA